MQISIWQKEIFPILLTSDETGNICFQFSQNSLWNSNLMLGLEFGEGKGEAVNISGVTILITYDWNGLGKWQKPFVFSTYYGGISPPQSLDCVQK